MFSNESWLTTGDRPNARELYSSVLYPQLWEMGPTEAESLMIARERWQPRQSYWLYQPSLRSIL